MGLESHATSRVEQGEDRVLNDLNSRNPGGLDKLKNNVTNIDAKKQEKLSKDLEALDDELGGASSEIRSLRNQLEGSQLNMQGMLTIERAAKSAAIREGVKIVKSTLDRHEDEALGFSEGSRKYMEGLAISDLPANIKGLKAAAPEEMKHKRKVESLKKISPYAFDAYIRASKAEKDKGLMQKSRPEILADVEKTFKQAIKAPLPVQGTFFDMVKNGEINERDYEKTLDKLEKELHELSTEYVGLLDPKIFGKKPAKEFEAWIKDRKRITEVRDALRILKNDYIPKRKETQGEFEALPHEISDPHKAKWENDLGHSEREALLAELKKLESKEGQNPFAQEFLQILTKNPKEVATKEYATLMADFTSHKDFEDQKALVRAFPLTELKERAKLTERFEGLSDEAQDRNSNFFSMNKEEKMVLLRALEGEEDGESDVNAWKEVLATEAGQQSLRSNVNNMLGTNRGRMVFALDRMGLEIEKSQSMTGKTNAEDRHAKKIGEAGGSSAEEKANTIHELDPTRTVDAQTGEEAKFHTFDLRKLEREGRMDQSALDEVMSEFQSGNVKEDDRDAFTRAKFVREDGREVNLQRETTQRDRIEGMVKEMLIDALTMTIESMSGKSVDRKQFEDMSEEESRQMLDMYQQSAKGRFNNVTKTLSTER